MDHNTQHPTAIGRKVLRIARRAIGACAFLLAVLVATEKPAYAYVDPGSGALIWQIAVSALVGAAFYFRKFITRILGKDDKTEKNDGGVLENESDTPDGKS